MVILIVLLVLTLIFLGLCFWSYTFIYQSPHKGQSDDRRVSSSEQMQPYREDMLAKIDALNDLPYQRVSLRSHDGLRLRGRYYHVADGAPVAICFHGYRGTPSRDFCAGSRILMDQGFNVLLAEGRAHMRSDGHAITFGVKERYDCLDWVNYCVKQFGEETKLLLVGISMGAATVLMASALPLPSQVCGIAADCPYTSPKAIIHKVSREMKFPAFPADLLSACAARIFAGFSLTAADAAEAVKEARVPILLIHGEDDRFVPCDMSREIYAANPEGISFHTFPDAGHGISYYLDPERYEKLLSEFAASVTQAAAK